MNPISVTATVSYRDAGPGYLLVVGILDKGIPPKIVQGIVTSSPDQCVNQLVLAALCTIQTSNPQGSEHLEFKIGGILTDQIGVGTWNLNMTAALVTSNNILVRNSGSSTPFSITISPLILTIKVPAGVTVSVDGVKQSPGPAQIPASAGSHNVSVPVTADLGNETRLRFARWTDGIVVPNRTVRISGSRSYEAIYVKQYRLSIAGQATSAGGQGWYDAGSSTTFFVADTEPMGGILGMLGGKLRFQAWYEDNRFLTDSSADAIVMDKPHTLTVLWKADYTTPLEFIAVVVVVLIFAFFIAQRITRAKPRRRSARKRRRLARHS